MAKSTPTWNCQSASSRFLQRPDKRFGQPGAAHRRDPPDLRQIGHRQDSRNDRHRNADLLATVAEAEVVVVVVVQLGDHGIRAAIDFAFQILQVRFQAGRFEVLFRIAGDGDPEMREFAADQGNQFVRVAQPAIGRAKRLLAVRRIAAQRDDVIHAGLGRLSQIVAQLFDRRADASQMRRYGKAEGPLDLADDVQRLVARRAAGAVGAGDEIRAVSHQLPQVSEQRGLPASVLGGNNSNDSPQRSGR
jgi:hypothetical protein